MAQDATTSLLPFLSGLLPFSSPFHFSNPPPQKKKDNLTLPKVYDRFTRFSLANPANKAGNQYVAVVHQRDGGRRLLDHAELQTGTEAHATEVSPYGRDVSKTGVRTLLLGATVEMLPLLRCYHC